MFVDLYSRTFSSVVTAVSVTCILCSHAGAAQIDFIGLNGVNRIVVDHLRERLYLGFSSTYGYDLATDTLLLSDGAIGFGAPFGLSPNGRLLVSAANGTSSSHPNQSWVTVNNLEAGTSQDFFFPREPHEGGAYAAAFADNSTLLVTTTFNGSGWVPLRRIDIQSGDVTIIGEVRQNTALAPSGDRSVVAFAEGNSSGGPFGYYDVATQVVHSGGRVGHHLHEIAANQNGTQFAIPSVGGLDIFNSSLQRLRSLSADYPTRYPTHVLYSPVSDVLYVSWNGNVGVGIAPKSLVAYDANTLGVLSILDSTSFGDSREFGRMAISADGRTLYVVQGHNFASGGGIAIYNVSQYGVPEPNSLLLSLSLGFLISCRRGCGRVF